MEPTNIAPELVKILQSVIRKRPRVVIDHILKHGYVTTEELESLYGYNHPPRAARDVREEGIPLETFRIKNSEGRSIAGYRFGDLRKIRRDRLGGRQTFSKTFKLALSQQNEGKCFVCLGSYGSRYL